MKTDRLLKIALLGLGCACIAGCSASTSQQSPGTVVVEGPEEVVLEAPVRTAPGVVEYVWEEPMVDVIEIPPGLDPEGVYYRPAHQSIVEIRQGRWKYERPSND
jgi:hypothetical protein